MYKTSRYTFPMKKCCSVDAPERVVVTGSGAY